MPNRYSIAQSNQVKFKEYFKQNMNELGLDLPKGVFNTLQDALEFASTIGLSIKTFGRNATLAELTGATFGLEKILLANTIRVNYYIGAVIGSIAVAAGKIIGNDTQIRDIYFKFHRKEYEFLNVPIFYREHREIIDTSIQNRRYYAVKAQKHN